VVHGGRALAAVVLAALVGAGALGAALYTATGSGGGSARAAAPTQKPRPALATPVNQHPAAGHFHPDGTKLDSCRDQRCYEQAFGNLAYDRGPTVALHVFDTYQRSNATVQTGCHRIAHMIGAASLAHFHGNVPRAFALGSSTCWSGYYHGILSYAFTGASTKAQLIRIARRVCESRLVRSTTFLAYQCVHGLGHGLMLQTGYKLPLSLSICDALADSWDRTSCTGGVFMENINGAINTAYGFRTPWVRDNDLVYPCDAVAERHKLYCYLMVTSRILAANGYDWRATARICRGVERAWVATCFQSYGRDASGSSERDGRRILSLCRIAGSGQGDCLYGAVRDIASNDADGRRAARFCNAEPTRFRYRCFFGIGTIVGGFSPTAAGRTAACRAAGRIELAPCLRGAGVRS
jgi:hypothetical protein